MHLFKFHQIILLLLGILLSGCIEDAPHDNPLDPVHGEQYSITGTVSTYYQPRKPLSDALVRLMPDNKIVFSDAQGNFRFSNLKLNSYVLSCALDGYSHDSSAFDLRTNLNQEFFLDGLPQFENIQLASHKRSHWFPLGDEYFLEAESQVHDSDGLGDIKNVFFKIPSISFVDTLAPTMTAGSFFIRIGEIDLPVLKIHQLIGQEIRFEVQDNFGERTLSVPIYLTRIIEFTPIVTAPIDFPLIDSDSLLFEWDPVVLPYPFTLNIELFQISLGVPIKIDELENIPSDGKSYLYTQPLLSGDYFWTLKIIDEFGNSSSSKEGSFKKN